MSSNNWYLCQIFGWHLHIPGVNYGVKLRIVYQSGNWATVVKKGHTEYLDRGDPHAYIPTEYMLAYFLERPDGKYVRFVYKEEPGRNWQAVKQQYVLMTRENDLQGKGVPWEI